MNDRRNYGQSDRSNQDKYDVIQAWEEFNSMQDPRTIVLQARIAELEEEVAELKLQIRWLDEALDGRD